jgi:hypothetical protein
MRLRSIAWSLICMYTYAVLFTPGITRAAPARGDRRSKGVEVSDQIRASWYLVERLRWRDLPDAVSLHLGWRGPGCDRPVEPPSSTALRTSPPSSNAPDLSSCDPHSLLVVHISHTLYQYIRLPEIRGRIGHESDYPPGEHRINHARSTWRRLYDRSRPRLPSAGRRGSVVHPCVSIIFHRNNNPFSLRVWVEGAQ